MDEEKLERLEAELIRRTLAGSVGRGGEVIPRPTNAQTGQFANFVASCLLDLNRKVDKLEKRKHKERRYRDGRSRKHKTHYSR